MTESFAEATDDGVQDNKRIIMLGGLAAVVALAAGAKFLVFNGSSDESTSLSAPITHVKRTPTSPVKTAVNASKGKPVTVPAASTVRLGRDPFLALYIVPAAAPAAASGTATSTTPASTSSTSVPATTTTTTDTTKAPAAKLHAMKLSRVYGTGKDQTAVFAIDGKTQLAKVGSVFGPTAELKLLSLQQGRAGAFTAVVQVGDGQPFDAATGQTLYVQ